MSHEIRTPMNAIIGFSTLLDTPDFTNEEKKDFRSLIRSNSESLLYLIENIMDFSMIESNQLKLVNKKFNLNDFINNIFESYSLRHTNTSVELKLNNELERDNYSVNSDEFRIKQIIENLMDNALKFTTKGFIELGVRRNSQYIHLYVKDTGHGIAINDMEFIFKQFVKLEEDQQTAKRGVGLGLTISKKLAELLGGHIKVTSQISVGSEFTLYLPIKILT